MSEYDDDHDFDGGTSGFDTSHVSSAFGFDDNADGGTVYDGTRYTHTSWVGRGKNACCGVLFGIALFVGSFALLGWNELRAVNTADALRECGSQIREAECDQVDELYTDHVVHISCGLRDIPTLQDDDFGVSYTTVALHRKVEMRQWREDSEKRCKKDNVGGGETCHEEYSYTKVWSSEALDNFHGPHADRYQNPSYWDYRSRDWVAERMSAGVYQLPPTLRSRVAQCHSCMEVVSNVSADTICSRPGSTTPQGCLWTATPSDGYFRNWGQERKQPMLGDLRVRFTQSTARDVSVVGVQTRGGSFRPYVHKNGYTCFLLAVGEKDSATMIADAQHDNVTLAWVLRLAGLLANWLGLYLISAPATLVLDLVPFIGPVVADCLNMGRAVVTFVAALGLSLATIAVAWLLVRPLLAMALLATALALLAPLVLLARKRRRARFGNGAATGGPWTDQGGSWYSTVPPPSAPPPGTSPYPNTVAYPPPQAPPPAGYPGGGYPAGGVQGVPAGYPPAAGGPWSSGIPMAAPVYPSAPAYPPTSSHAQPYGGYPAGGVQGVPVGYPPAADYPPPPPPAPIDPQKPTAPPSFF
mmetsp:Transcript_9896/g.20665  ORF Transcript_9896/g.20665 Transcript_9896/m.20665 type:complete len:584 (-) Transcript_9896:92-1843(-)